MNTILLSYGTRPEYIKIKPLFDELKNYKVLFTGQHKNIVDTSKVDYFLEIKDGGNRLDSIVQSCLNNDYIFNGITHVLVQGDTTSALAIALSAFHRQIKVIHLEAGLRTWDKENPYPEEVNRQIISSIADIHLCPTEQNKKNLIEEKRKGSVYVTGNSGLDNIDRTGITYDPLILVTLHRRENHPIIDKYFDVIEKLAQDNEDLKFIIPIHPNPNVMKHRNIFKTVNVINPVDHDEMINMIKKCRFVISDSGGLQEECSFLNKKVIVCRKITERPESVGVHSFMCEHPSKLSNLFYQINSDYKINSPCPYGDGNSSKRISRILNNI